MHGEVLEAEDVVEGGLAHVLTENYGLEETSPREVLYILKMFCHGLQRKNLKYKI